MFGGCSSAINFDYCFYNLTALTSVSNSMFVGCTSAEEFNYTFYNCTALKNIPTFYAGKNFSYCFAYTAVTSLTNEMLWSCAVEDLSYMFYNCTKLSSMNMEFLETNSTIYSLEYTFAECSQLTLGSITHLWEYDIATSHSGCFKNCATSASNSVYLEFIQTVPSDWQ
jgi:hypothetical protein